MSKPKTWTPIIDVESNSLVISFNISNSYTHGGQDGNQKFNNTDLLEFKPLSKILKRNIIKIYENNLYYAFNIKSLCTLIKNSKYDNINNPYIFVNTVLTAGLDGIKNKLSLEKPVLEDAGEYTDIEDSSSLKVLPRTFSESLSFLKRNILF